MALWLEQEAAAEARKEAASESALIARRELEGRKDAEEGLKREISALQAFQRKIAGYNRPEDCLRVFRGHIELLKRRAAREKTSESKILAINEAIQSTSSGSLSTVEGKMVLLWTKQTTK